MQNRRLFPRVAYLIILLLISVYGADSWAADAIKSLAASAPVAPPEPVGNKLLDDFKNSGAKLYYLGHDAGLNGWFVMKDKQIQIAYITEDGKGTLFGALFDKDGTSITTRQIQSLAASDNQFAVAMGMSGPLPGLPTAGNTSPASSVPASPASPGEKLLADLMGAQGVTLGGNASAPDIAMVIDPADVACQKTWQKLRQYVLDGKLRIRMIPVVAPDSDSERAAAVLLKSADPLTAWDKYASGDKTALAGSADPAAIAGIRANHGLADNWKIHATPTMVYRDKSQKVKILEGQPENITLFINDVL